VPGRSFPHRNAQGASALQKGDITKVSAPESSVGGSTTKTLLVVGAVAIAIVALKK